MTAYQDPADLQAWYEDMAERHAAEREHAEGTCGDDCWLCSFEDSEYDRWRDDERDGLR